MDIVAIAYGQLEPMTLEERIGKAISNINKALGGSTKLELEKPLHISGILYLTQQKELLVRLLGSDTW